MRTNVRRTAVLAVVLSAMLAAIGVRPAAGGTTRTHFDVSYGPPTISCSGFRIVSGGSNPVVKDEETCLAHTEFYAPGVYYLADPSFGGWCSDFEGSRSNFTTCRLAIGGTLVVSLNPDGTHVWKITAFYKP